MSHSDSIKALPTNGKLASTHDVEFAAQNEGETTMPFNTIQVFIQLTVQNVRKLLVKIAEVPQNFTNSFC
jgi:hypothetical protein